MKYLGLVVKKGDVNYDIHFVDCFDLVAFSAKTAVSRTMSQTCTCDLVTGVSV